MAKKKLYAHNPTNLTCFNDISDTEGAYIRRLQEISRSIQTGVKGKIIGGNHSIFLQNSYEAFREEHLESLLIKTITSNQRTDADKEEAENLLVARYYAKIHNITI